MTGLINPVGYMKRDTLSKKTVRPPLFNILRSLDWIKFRWRQNEGATPVKDLINCFKLNSKEFIWKRRPLQKVLTC